MNYWYLAASIVALITTFIHIFAGGRGIYRPVYNCNLAPEVRGVMLVCWHAVTAIIIILTVGLYLLSQTPNVSMHWILFAINLSWATLFIYYGITELGNITQMPQWIIFTLIASLMTIGLMT